ncbi:hypothetical protein [Paraburkholderia sp.]|uniref:hypothetical protein n=1 Tax=Paraburkholderia sp. TaxID=1926495 RepID=UPI003D701B9B
MNAMQSMPADKREIFEERLKTIMRSAGEKAKLCIAAHDFGAPAYYPAYMVNHGLGAMQAAMSGQTTEDGGLRSDFDSTKGWSDALTGYLQCD